MSGRAAELYEEDFVRWSEQQSAALREAAARGTSLPLDWENLAEEIEALGRSQRRELRSRIAVIVEHLIKLQCSPAVDPRRGWMDTISRERSEIELVIADSPSLKSEVPGMVAAETSRVAGRVVSGLRRHGEATSEVTGKIMAVTYTADQILGDWFPGDPPPAADGERG